MNSPPMAIETLNVLYVEDEQDILNDLLPHLQSRCREGRSHGVRSLNAAMDIIEGGFHPDLVIFDTGILRRDNDPTDSIEAARELYAFLIEEGYPVVVLSGRDKEEIQAQEPYRSHEPIAFLKKPAKTTSIDEALDLYLKSSVRRS